MDTQTNDCRYNIATAFVYIHTVLCLHVVCVCVLVMVNRVRFSGDVKLFGCTFETETTSCFVCSATREKHPFIRTISENGIHFCLLYIRVLTRHNEIQTRKFYGQMHAALCNCTYCVHNGNVKQVIIKPKWFLMRLMCYMVEIYRLDIYELLSNMD